MSVWQNAFTLCQQNPEWKEKESYYQQKIIEYGTTTEDVVETTENDYETLIKKQESENV